MLLACTIRKQPMSTILQRSAQISSSKIPVHQLKRRWRMSNFINHFPQSTTREVPFGSVVKAFQLVLQRRISSQQTCQPSETIPHPLNIPQKPLQDRRDEESAEEEFISKVSTGATQCQQQSITLHMLSLRSKQRS